MAHRKAKLTPHGRLLLVERVLVEGWAPAHAAAAVGVSRATVYKWLRRYRAEGAQGLEDRASTPRSRPQALPGHTVRRILRARRQLGFGPHRLSALVGSPRSTIYGVLRRFGCSRLHDQDAVTGTPVRYVRDHPGELLHLDVKKLARIPDGGGHHLLGRSPGTRRRRGAGYDYVHVAVDDCSRFAYVAVCSDERGATTARFLLEAAHALAAHGVRVERVLTDRALNYTRSTRFQDAVATLGARHLLTRPYRPQTNGKAERFIRTLLQEWAYRRLYRSNTARLEALPHWVRFYNQRRPHTALGGRPPAAAL